MLTTRQKSIMEFLVQGISSYKIIAKELNISRSTVRSNLSTIYLKSHIVDGHKEIKAALLYKRHKLCHVVKNQCTENLSLPYEKEQLLILFGKDTQINKLQKELDALRDRLKTLRETYMTSLVWQTGSN